MTQPAIGTVLVIDDDESTLDALCELLELEGLRIEVAFNAYQAQDKLRETRFDVVVSDVMMPGNGHTVIHYVRAVQPQTPVIVVTGEDPKTLQNLRDSGGAFALIEKLSASHLLIPTLRKALAGRSTCGASGPGVGHPPPDPASSSSPPPGTARSMKP
jgi:DNA-binding NtrC family response regulator